MSKHLSNLAAKFATYVVVEVVLSTDFLFFLNFTV